MWYETKMKVRKALFWMDWVDYRGRWSFKDVMIDLGIISAVISLIVALAIYLINN